MSINLNKPASWEVFKALTEKTQEEYLRHLMEVYGANATSLAEMFGVQPLTVRRYLTARNLNITFPVGRSMNTQQKLAWEKFCKEECDNTPGLCFTPLAATPVEDTVAAPTKQEKAMAMKNVSLSFSGRIDVNAIANSLRHILGDDMVGDIQIICSLG